MGCIDIFLLNETRLSQQFGDILFLENNLTVIFHNADLPLVQLNRKCR